MFTLVYENRGLVIYVKGASEIILSHCTKILDKDGKSRNLGAEESQNIITNVIEKYAGNYLFIYILG